MDAKIEWGVVSGAAERLNETGEITSGLEEQDNIPPPKDSFLKTAVRYLGQKEEKEMGVEGVCVLSWTL